MVRKLDQHGWRVHIVTPAKNEESNLVGLARSLSNANAKYISLWTIVDDASTDNTESVIGQLESPFRVEYLKFNSPGTLISGGAYKAWMFGANFNLTKDSRTHVMKLDADVRLEDDYFDQLYNSNYREFDMLGGVILKGSGREQRNVIPGPVKLYSERAFELVSMMPKETGFDVLDEVFCKHKGLKVMVVPTAKFSLSRSIGASEGRLHGRFRNGRVCRWTGYSHLYFIVHLTRFFFRKPFIFGAVWMLAGYLTAPESPYDESLRNLLAVSQRDKLKQLLRNPINWIKVNYYQ
jgi:dolichol-phosphate mannosyltransferase